ncbi:MAG TPA: tRNA (adenosine(37)-N6)-dimethylallyltransferase MiaA [Jatrophihabitans sp.]|jgi:tRNA dimethylallyltransferase
MTDAELAAARLTRRVVAVVGPTATGKSDLAIAIAREVGGEIVNADSMQLYSGLDIGTAKLPLSERGGIEHHLLDIWPLQKSAAVAQYQAIARATIDAIHAHGKTPVVVGGSGLYVRGTLDSLEFPGEDAAIRLRLYAELDELGPEVLHARLATIDPAAAMAILPSNGRRIARALEVIELTGEPFTATMPGFEAIYDVVSIGLDRTDLDERVRRRVHHMLETGWLEEIRALLPVGLRGSPTAGKALGYQQLMAVLDEAGEVVGDFDEAVQVTIRATIRFVRRQRRWFRRDPRIRWLDATDPALHRTAIDLATN